MPTKETAPVMKANNLPYLWAVVALTFLSAGLVISILSLRPLADPLVVLGGVLGSMAPIMASVFAFMKAQETNLVSRETHLAVNSRLDSFIASASKAARAEGVIQGTADEQHRTSVVEVGKL